MASQLLRIEMSGGGPYGFRLLGGDKSPLTVAKIRPSSKASVAGLLEGDVILAINNICSQGLSHAAATALMEGNKPTLTVHALRGRSALNEVDSAAASLGPEIHRLTAAEASAIVQNSSATSSNETQPEVEFRLQAPPSGGSLKQMRIARRESRESDAQTPDDVVGQSSQDTPGYYAREERTSTDGGKTTRIVEEVQTEKFGGTTLTKVTKQEFSSYKSSSADPRVGAFPPEFSITRSEEHGYPIPLGAPSDGGNQLRDERGWTTTSSVHKSSVRTEPYEVRIDTTQEPTRTYVVYQDGSQDNLERPELSRGQQPIPTIEVQFHPSETGFGVETKPPRVVINPKFEIRVGKEVTFQPKIQASYETTQNQSEVYPAPKVHEPSIQNQSGTYSKFSHESNQSNYGTPPQLKYGNEPKSGYLEKQSSRPLQQYGNRNETQYKADTYQQFGHTVDSPTGGSGPQFGFSAEPDYPYRPSANIHLEHAAKPQPAPHIHPGPADKPALRNEPETNLQFGYDSDHQPRTQSQFGYNPEPQTSNHPRSGYNPEHQSGTHPQHGYNQKPQPEAYSQLGYNQESQPRNQSQYGYNQEPQPRAQSNFGYKPEPQPEANSQLGYNREPQPRTQSNFGYNPEPQPSNHPKSGYNPEHQSGTHPQHGYSKEPQPETDSHLGYNQEPQPKTQPHYGYNQKPQPRTHPQFGYNQEPSYPYRPSSHLQYDKNSEPLQPEYNEPDSHLYGAHRPEPEHVTNPQFGYTSQPETSQPAYNPESQYKHGAHPRNTYEPHPPPAQRSYPANAAPPSFNRQLEPQFYDAAPAPQAAPASWGQNFPRGPAGGQVVPGSYNPPEAVYDANDRGPTKPPQMDRVKRVDINTAPTWIPGSKLPTKQPLQPLPTYSSNPPLIGDPRGPQAGNPVATDGYYDQSPEGGWHEAPVAGVRNNPNVRFSRVHDPTKPSTETDPSFEYGNAPRPNLEYGAVDYHPPYGREEEEAPSGQWSVFGGQPNPSAAGRLPGQADVWRPPGFGYAGPAAEEFDRSRGFGAAPAPPPPPPAPPLVPMMVGSAPAPPYGYPVMPTPLAPPPPVAPPIDQFKIYRGSSSADGGYGFTSLEDRVKMAKTVAYSVLAPENQNSRGQKMYLRRRDNSHKWTLHGPDPVPEKPSLQESTRSNPNAWAPKSHGAPQPGQHLLSPTLAPQPLVRPTSDVFPDVNGRPEEPPSGGSSYSLSEDVALSNGRGGLLFAKRRAKADQWGSAESTGRQGAPQNIRQGAPQSTSGYGAPIVPPSLGYANSQYAEGVVGGKGGEAFAVTNRLKDMIKPKNSTAALWNQQMVPQSAFAQDGQARGPSSFSVGSNPNPGGYRTVHGFQGTSVISSAPVAPPSVQPQKFMTAPRFTPKQFGNRAIVGQGVGFTDL